MTVKEELTTRTLTEQVYERLKRAILGRQLEPGQRLVTMPLAKRYQVSLTPVREALRLLEKDGLVRFLPHKGAVVSLPSAQDFRDLFAVRAALEGLAVESACPRLSAADLDALEQSCAVARRCLAGAASAADWIQADEDFHERIARAAGNPFLHEQLGALRNRIRLFMHLSHRFPERVAGALAEHEAVLAALRTRDPAAARAAMDNHLRSALEGSPKLA